MPAVQCLEILDLSGDHGVEASLGGRQSAQRVPDRRDVARSGQTRDKAGDTDEEAQLRAEPHRALMIRHDMSGGPYVDLSRQGRVVVHDHPLPRDVRLLEDQHAIRLIEAGRQRVVEGAHAGTVERRTRPQRQPGQV